MTLVLRTDLAPGDVCSIIHNVTGGLAQELFVLGVLEDGFITQDGIIRGGPRDITGTELSCNHYEFHRP